MTPADAFAGLAPDAPAAHAGLKAARELVRAGEHAVALDVLAGPACRDTPLATLLRADLLLAEDRPGPALALVQAVHDAHGDTGQGLVCAGHAALAQGDRPAAAEYFARAAAADPGRIAARVNAAAFRPPPAVVAASPPAAIAVTSLPPSADARCRAAVASWTAAGFTSIVSVNAAREIALLADRFPEVAFVPGGPAAETLFGRPYAGLPELLAAGAAGGAAVVAIVNADIAVAAGPDFAGRLATAATGGAVVACRVDVAPDGGAAPAYYDVGFDLCAVDARLAERPELAGFFLGLPWWDYALPLAVARAGGMVRFCPAPVCRHAVHDTAWSHRAFLSLGRHFVRRFWPQLELELLAGDRVVDAGIEAVLAGLGGRTAALLRRAPDAGLWDRTGFCPHDPGFAAAPLPRTRVNIDG